MLLHEEPGHDRLAGARVVRQEEAQRLARQHRLVDRGDLVRQRVHVAGVDRDHGVEQVREADAVGLEYEAEERAAAVEAPGPPLLRDLQARLVVAVEELVLDLPGRRLVRQLQGVVPEPLGLDDRDQRVRDQAADSGARRERLQCCDAAPPLPRPQWPPSALAILWTGMRPHESVAQGDGEWRV